MRKRIGTLFSGALFHTLRDKGETFGFLGERDGKISYLSDTRPANGSYVREVAFNGLHIYPSLTDTHLHLLYSIMMAASGYNICEIKDGGVVPDNMAGTGEWLRARCSSRGVNDIIIGSGFIPPAIAEKRMPTRRELDDWTEGRRTVVYSIDGHSSSLSTSMLRALGIDPEGHDGVLRGTEHEFRQGRVMEILAATIGAGDIARGVAAFTNRCAHYGITRVCAMDGNGDVKNDWLTKLTAAIASRMDIDVFLYPQYMDIEKARPFWKKMSRRRIGGCGDWEMDGAVGSHSAAFYSPYADTADIAECYYSQGEVDRALQRADAEGCQIATHAIGDAAIDRILAAHEKLRSKTIHRIEHFEFPTDAAVQKLIACGNLAVTVQPGFSWIDARYLKSYENYLPQETILRQVPLKRLYDAGVALCGSSDSPVQDIDPFLQMLGMTDFCVPGQSLTNYQAMRCYTLNPARALEQAMNFGTLEINKEASFFAVKTDILAAGHDTLAGVHALHTYIRGKKLGGKKGNIAELCGMILRRAKKI